MRADWRAEVALAGIALVWGSTFVLVKSALDDASTLLFLAVRFGFGTLALWLPFRRRGPVVKAPSEWIAGGWAGFWLFAGYFLQTAGLRLTTPSKSAFLTGLYIVLVPLLGSLVYRKELHPFELLGAALATAGMALMTSPGWQFQIGLGDLLTIGCAVAFAAHMLVLEHYARLIRLESLAVVQLATVAAGAGMLCWWVETPKFVWSSKLVVALAVTGLIATALAFMLQTWAQARTTATRAAFIFALEPVFAGVTSAVAGEESFSAEMLAGAVFILSGIVLAPLKRAGYGKHPSK